jgi:tetratricopeptide (TPR) repeat protein
MTLGLILANSGDIVEGRKHLAEAVRLEPRDAFTNFHYAVESHRQGNLEEATVHYQRALRYYPDFAQALCALASIRIREDHSSLYNVEEAVAFAERACELTQYKDPASLEILAKIYAATGQLDRALGTGSQALRIAVAMGDDDLADRIKRLVAGWQSHVGDE